MARQEEAGRERVGNHRVHRVKRRSTEEKEKSSRQEETEEKEWNADDADAMDLHGFQGEREKRKGKQSQRKREGALASAEGSAIGQIRPLANGSVPWQKDAKEEGHRRKKW